MHYTSVNRRGHMARLCWTLGGGVTKRMVPKLHKFLTPPNPRAQAQDILEKRYDTEMLPLQVIALFDLRG